MRRVLDLRITHWGWKTLYVVAVLLVGPLPTQIGASLGAYEVGFVVGSFVRIGLFLFAARVFRGRGEPVTPTRPWWQMTARSKLSRRLGYLFAALKMVNVLSVVLAFTGMFEVTAPSMIVSIISVLECGVLAYLYLNSAVRLRRRGEAPIEPNFKPNRIPVG